MQDTKQSLRRVFLKAIWLSAGAAAAVVALLMFAAALFVWASARFDTVAAFLLVGCVFAVIAGVSLLIVRLYPTPTTTQERRTSAVAWLEPSIVAAGFDVARTIGGRRATTLVAGAVAAAWLLSKSQALKDLRP